jgi:hypothetical protein
MRFLCVLLYHFFILSISMYYLSKDNSIYIYTSLCCLYICVGVKGYEPNLRYIYVYRLRIYSNVYTHGLISVVVVVVPCCHTACAGSVCCCVCVCCTYIT